VQIANPTLTEHSLRLVIRVLGGEDRHEVVQAVKNELAARYTVDLCEVRESREVRQ